MRKADAITYFGNQTKFARAIGKAGSTVSEYPDVLPLSVALITEKLTRGRLKADLSMYPDAPEGLRR